jgi:DNA-binding beta-propeller fold protein YncE
MLAPWSPSALAWPQCCGHWYTPGQLAFSPDGRWAYASDNGYTIAFRRDPATGDLVIADAYSGGGRLTEMAPDGRTLYLTSVHDSSIRAFARDEATGALTPAPGYFRNAAPFHLTDIEVSPDGRQLYLSSGDYDNVVAILDRDPQSGALSLRTELPLEGAAGLAVSPDGRFLYVASDWTASIAVFSRADDGSLTPIQTVDAGVGPDIELAPDGLRLYQGPAGPLTFARDPDTGLLTRTEYGTIIDTTSDAPPDGLLAVAPGSRTVYAIDNGPDDRLHQLAVTENGLAHVRTYREPADGAGLREPLFASAPADGASLYVPSIEEGTRERPNPPGQIAILQRQPDDALAFRSLFLGPPFDGRPPWDLGTPRIEINGGDEYTNDPHVTLRTHDLLDLAVMGLLVSNDGGFGPESRRLEKPENGVYRWKLAESGPERQPKTVYARAFGFVSYGVLSDEIVLDQRPPELLAVERTAAERLRIFARDRLSGVRRMQVAARRGRPGRWLRFRRVTARGPSDGRAWVRVRDGAGNPSRWRRATTGRAR